MAQTPIGRESDRLIAVENISNDVWRQEREIDHLLNAAF
jgi:hypothetical protein